MTNLEKALGLDMCRLTVKGNLSKLSRDKTKHLVISKQYYPKASSSSDRFLDLLTEPYLT